MSEKIGRNDHCPCGSGKKYKKCCAKTGTGEVEQEPKSHGGAVARALDWLTRKHRKAVKLAIEEALFKGLSKKDYDVMTSLDQETWQSIHINATEWLLAEGHILVKGEYKRVSEYLLGPDGPLLTVDQRNWIEQLAEHPLCLYEVTDVIPGQQMTLCNVLDTRVKPVTVYEKSGSDPSMLGSCVGFRIMDVDGHFELSGAVYSFSQLKSQEVAEHLRAAKQRFGRKKKALQEELSSIIRHKWLEEFYAPMPIPATCY